LKSDAGEESRMAGEETRRILLIFKGGSVENNREKAEK
jgi:hypothetical protein